MATGDRGDRGKPGAGGDFRWHEFLSAPGTDDDVGGRCDYVLHRDDAVLGVFFTAESLEHIDATRGFDQLGDPADPGNHRVVPLLEIDFWSAREPRRLLAYHC